MSVEETTQKSSASENAWHALDRDDVLQALDTTPEGLSDAQVAERQAEHGPNTVQRNATTSKLAILLHQFTSPLIYVLLIAFGITVFIGHYPDAIVIAAVLLINAVIGFYQEYRAENAMAALANLVSPTARVRRDGEPADVESEKLVPGDIVLLESGSLVPADLRLLSETDLKIDESILTGESAAVSKTIETVSTETVVGDRSNMAHMGSAVTTGRAVGVVVATGADTEIGTIAGQMRETTRAATPLQTRMRHFGNRISIAIVGVSVVVFGIGLLQGIAVTDVFLLAVAIAVAAIPEGLPIVMTVALAVSVARMADRNAIIRRLPAVETLGSCTVILSDKTGTLTENRMTVQQLRVDGSVYTVTGGGDTTEGAIEQNGEPVAIDEASAVYDALRAGVLANESRIRTQMEDNTERIELLGDPTETALLVAGAKVGLHREQLLETTPEIGQIPFESDRQFAATAHKTPDGPQTYFKGAPERIIAMCTDARVNGASEPIDREAILAAAHEMANEGLRVLAVATGAGDRTESESLDGLTLLGLIGMRDPPRNGVPDAIVACHNAGMRVLMVTGDHAATAGAIAKQIGIESDTVLTGADVAALSDEELTEQLQTTSVFARISPTQKLRLTELLQADGEIVAVTGDGVNDAPALKSAHIGAAMGITGTDVAKEASEMVLTDDNFTTIYAAVEEGRTVFANIAKATTFLLSTGVGLVLAFLATFTLTAVGVFAVADDDVFPLLLIPAQVLWLNVVTNGIQDVALAFEPGEPQQYERPPNDPNAGLLSGFLLERTAVAGVLLAVVAVTMFWWQLSTGVSIEYAQTATLTLLVISMALYVGACRSETQSIFEKSLFSNRMLFVGTIAAVAIHIGALYFGPTQFLLGVQPLTTETWLTIGLLAPATLVVVEIHKYIRR